MFDDSSEEPWFGPSVPKRVKAKAQNLIKVQVKQGRRLPASAFACTDCGHIWHEGDYWHQYDHFRGYEQEHWLDVQPVCARCHNLRAIKRGERGYSGRKWIKAPRKPQASPQQGPSSSQV